MKLTAVFVPAAEGGFTALVEEIPGAISEGETIEEAREMAEDAITCHLQGLLKDDEEIPIDPFAAEPPVIEELRIAV